MIDRAVDVDSSPRSAQRPGPKSATASFIWRADSYVSERLGPLTFSVRLGNLSSRHTLKQRLVRTRSHLQLTALSELLAAAPVQRRLVDWKSIRSAAAARRRQASTADAVRSVRAAAAPSVPALQRRTWLMFSAAVVYTFSRDRWISHRSKWHTPSA